MLNTRSTQAAKRPAARRQLPDPLYVRQLLSVIPSKSHLSAQPIQSCASLIAFDRVHLRRYTVRIWRAAGWARAGFVDDTATAARVSADERLIARVTRTAAWPCSTRPQERRLQRDFTESEWRVAFGDVARTANVSEVANASDALLAAVGAS